MVFETVFVLAHTFRRPKTVIGETLLAVLELPGVLLPRKRLPRRAFTLYVDFSIPCAVAYHAAVAEAWGRD